MSFIVPARASAGRGSHLLPLFATGGDCVWLRSWADSLELRIIAREFGLANKFHQSEADGLEFAEQQLRRDAVLVGRPVDVDHHNLALLAQGRSQPPEERIRLFDLVVHMDQ